MMGFSKVSPVLARLPRGLGSRVLLQTGLFVRPSSTCNTRRRRKTGRGERKKEVSEPLRHRLERERQAAVREKTSVRFRSVWLEKSLEPFPSPGFAWGSVCGVERKRPHRPTLLPRRPASGVPIVTLCFFCAIEACVGTVGSGGRAARTVPVTPPRWNFFPRTSSSRRRRLIVPTAAAATTRCTDLT
jgi:hypothetical protein